MQDPETRSISMPKGETTALTRWSVVVCAQQAAGVR